MKRWAGFGYVLAFLLLCAGAWLFLQPFTFTGGEALPYVDWETTVWVDGDGAEHPPDPLEGQPELPEGAFFRFALTLPQREDDYALVFETGNMDFTLSLDGEAFFSTRALELPEALNQSRVNISLPTGGGERLVMEMTPLGQIGIFPPLPRLASDALETAGQMAYANHYAIPAGATTLATLLLWGLFLVGAYQGRGHRLYGGGANPGEAASLPPGLVRPADKPAGQRPGGRRPGGGAQPALFAAAAEFAKGLFGGAL